MCWLIVGQQRKRVYYCRLTQVKIFFQVPTIINTGKSIEIGPKFRATEIRPCREKKVPKQNRSGTNFSRLIPEQEQRAYRPENLRPALRLKTTLREVRFYTRGAISTMADTENYSPQRHKEHKEHKIPFFALFVSLW